MGIHVMTPFYIATMVALPPPTIMKFYPDPSPEVTSVDGRVTRKVARAGESWASVRNGVGTTANDSLDRAVVDIVSGDDTDKWWWIYRSIVLFDTGALGAGAKIVSAILRLYGNYYYVTPGFGDPKVCIVSSNPASNVAVTTADYNTLGSTPLSDTKIPYSSWNISGYNEFPLNAAGLAAIAKTGITKFGVREYSHDALDSPPAWQKRKGNYVQFYTAERGEGYKPELEVTYQP